MPVLTIPDVPQSQTAKPVVRFVNKDTSQTHLRIGHLSIKENDPDYVALAIANDVPPSLTASLTMSSGS